MISYDVCKKCKCFQGIMVLGRTQHRNIYKVSLAKKGYLSDDSTCTYIGSYTNTENVFQKARWRASGNGGFATEDLAIQKVILSRTVPSWSIFSSCPYEVEHTIFSTFEQSFALKVDVCRECSRSELEREISRCAKDIFLHQVGDSNTYNVGWGEIKASKKVPTIQFVCLTCANIGTLVNNENVFDSLKLEQFALGVYHTKNQVAQRWIIENCTTNTQCIKEHCRYSIEHTVLCDKEVVFND